MGLKIRQGELSLNPCVPTEWPSFEVILRLGERVVTVRWQRGETTTLKADRFMKAGEVVRLAELPVQASVVVFTATE